MAQRDWNNRSDVLQAASEAQTAGDQQAFGMLAARLKELPPPKRDYGNMDHVRSALVESRIAGDFDAERRLTDRLSELEQVANNPTTGMDRGD